ncbi:flagellar protein FliT [Variovorax dokdonensis]|uniref:Flagellar protein FliT n=1 Tax=Variovorax dokdonensis TaxID=344883 RepID=A0ABT7N4V1_9BURK|nr:flagellar protein FliT [Variovorax dokdonensis]MDM0042972.1 flagellar protein FliT [Variovorax dokdonensis]
MAHANEVLHCYSRLAEHAQHMAQLAAAREWAQLPALETECAALIARLKDLPSAESLEPSLREQACQLIERIRADQETVARLVQPQLNDLLTRMGSLSAQRSLDKAYGPRH